jgi:N-acetylglutamate synthase-like GNAT family acetyltransferase
MKYIRLRLTENSESKETIYKLLYFAAVTSSDSDANYRFYMFVSFCRAYFTNLGQLYMMQDGNKTVAFCFVFDKWHAPTGAYHIHSLSVFKNVRSKGYGRDLLQCVLSDLNGEPVFLECHRSNVEFFKLNGFHINHAKSLPHDMHFMYANSDGSHDSYNGFDMSIISESTEPELDKLFDALGKKFGAN